jgi:hypothetical protein
MILAKEQHRDKILRRDKLENQSYVALLDREKPFFHHSALN